MKKEYSVYFSKLNTLIILIIIECVHHESEILSLIVKKFLYPDMNIIFFSYVINFSFKYSFSIGILQNATVHLFTYAI